VISLNYIELIFKIKGGFGLKIKNKIIGWVGVIITVIVSSFWPIWGTFENFHEGWYYESFIKNIAMFIFQYLILSLIFILLALLSLKFKKISLILHLALGVTAILFFRVQI
jgi:hypothetical protein